VGDRLLVPGDPLRDLGADRLDPHGRLGQVGGDRGVGHDDRDRGVAGDVAVVEPERAGDGPGRQVVVHRHRVAVDRHRVAGGVGPAVERDPARHLAGRPVPVQVVVGVHADPVRGRHRSEGRAPLLRRAGQPATTDQRQPDVVGRLEPDHDLLADVDLVGVAPDDVGREADGRVLGERHVGDDVRGLEAGQPPVAVDGERHDGAAARHHRGLPRAAAAGRAHRHRRVDERLAVLALLDPQATVGARGPEPLVGRGELGEWPHRQNVLDRNSTAGVAGGNDPEIPELK
jgi:hypothetical protein